LRSDPGGVYGKMDFATRDRYRHVVERIGKSSRLSETEVARNAIQIAREAAAKDDSDDRAAHVGFYLIDKGLVQLERLEARKGTDIFFSLPWSPLSSKFLNSPSIP
jgi:cyclic beta-1,2-glucan synthetase